MTTDIDPNFDQLLIICGVICVIVIAFVLFMIKFPDTDAEYNDNIEELSDANLAQQRAIKSDSKPKPSEEQKI